MVSENAYSEGYGFRHISLQQQKYNIWMIFWRMVYNLEVQFMIIFIIRLRGQKSLEITDLKHYNLKIFEYW